VGTKRPEYAAYIFWGSGVAGAGKPAPNLRSCKTNRIQALLESKEMVKIKGEEKKKKRRRFQPLTDIEAEISLRAQAKGFAGEQLILMHV
jgi:hypothetical protein